MLVGGIPLYRPGGGMLEFTTAERRFRKLVKPAYTGNEVNMQRFYISPDQNYLVRMKYFFSSSKK